MNAVTFYRIGRWCYERRIPAVPKLMYRLIFLVYNSSIPMSAEIGEGTTFGYGGMGVVLHGRCCIGKHVLIAQQVTIGGRSGKWEVPVIEDNCFLGAGAKILGPIRIGEGSVVGANAVVLEDVPSRSVVAGVPARVIRRGIDIPDYRDGDFTPGRTAGDERPRRKVADETTVEIIQEPERFEHLKQEWNELHEASASPCLFLTWEWLFTWWKHLSDGRKLYIVTVRRDGELVAIAPLALRPPRLSRLLPFRSLEFMGTGSVGSNYLDVIIRRGREQEVLQALTDYLKHGKLMLKLAELQRNSCFAATLATQLHLRSWSLSQAKTSICPFIKLSGHSWESYLDTLGQKKRYNIRRDLRRMANQFDLRLEQVRVEEQRQEALAQLVSLHNMRWRDRGGSNAFHTPGLLSFHEELSRLALERGWLRLFTLWLNGKPAASLYGFMFHRRFYFYQSGFNPTYSMLSLGTIMVALTVMSAIEEGVEEYDFLGGDEQYKLHLARDARELGWLELYPPGARGLFYKQAMMLRQAVKGMAGEVTPHAFADRISSVQRA